MIPVALTAFMALVLGGAFAYSLYENGTQVIANIILALPEGGTLPHQVHEAARLFGSYVMSLNWFLPVDTVFTLMALSWNIVLALISFYVLRYIVNFVRGVATRGFLR